MSAAEALGEILLSRERLAELSGFTDAEVDECEQAGVIHKTDGGYCGSSWSSCRSCVR
jgi:hypothetical protein